MSPRLLSIHRFAESLFLFQVRILFLLLASLPDTGQNLLVMPMNTTGPLLEEPGTNLRAI